MKILLLALPLPLFAAVVVLLRDLPRSWAQWKPQAQRIALLFALGAYAANPFLAGAGMGTGEAYNYSLAIADGVTQLRSGELPALVGQTEYAFNGRIHPLRTAPYFVYAAGALDFLTFRHLSFWELQCLVLTLSLIGSVFAFYAAMRYFAGASRPVSLAGTALWALSPGVLSVTYSMDLYMTVTTLPFIPVAIGANIYSFKERSWRTYLAMGLALAFTWLAHPPIALWISASTIVLQALVWLTRKPSLSAVAGLAAGVLAAAGIVVFGFASTLTMQDGGGLMNSQDYSPMMTEMRRVFPASLHPVSGRADLLSDFQLGYVGWLLLLLLWVGGLLRRQLAVLGLAALATFYLMLTLPVGNLTEWLWLHLPPMFPNLTNIWPMQRLYVVTTLLVLLGAGVLSAWWQPAYDRSPVFAKTLLVIFLAAFSWTAWQAQPFLHRGNGFLKGKVASQDVHRSENVDITVISYAMLGVPSYFSYGVIDSLQWFRLLRATDRTEMASNWAAPEPGPVRANGAFRPLRGSTADDVPLGPSLRLKPGKRYVLEFQFKSSPVNGLLVISGEHFYRQYALPSSNTARGFGMQPGNGNRIGLWTTNPSGEELKLRIAGAGVAKQLVGAFAEFVLYEVDPARLPVKVDQIYPLAGSVKLQEPAFVDTPRRFIPGYRALVDGTAVATERSPEGSVMFPVPAGDHTFTLSYVGPPKLRMAFWISFSTFLVLLLAGIGAAVRYAIPRILAWRNQVPANAAS